MNQPHPSKVGHLPHRFFRYGVGGSLFDQITKLSPRQRYIAEQSMRRFDRRLDKTCGFVLLRGEIGTFNGMTIRSSQP